MIRAIITDIEGTTTSIRFVMDILFPYARKRLPDFVKTHADENSIRDLLDEVAEISGVENDLDSLIQQLLQWIDEDKKIAPLKTLQGVIWKSGFETGDFKGHVYADVAPVLQKWHAQNVSLYVYSSGSTEAQQLLFSHSESGDLTPLFSGYFDTRIGNKRDANSYMQIINKIGLVPDEILFLSDNEHELDAAAESGMRTTQLVRDETSPSLKHPVVHRFDEIEPK